MPFRKYRLTRIGPLPGASGPGAGSGEARDVNATGKVAGDQNFSGAFGSPGPVRHHAFLWNAGATNDLGDAPGGGDSSVARAINVVGKVVGEGHTAAGLRALLWENGAIKDLGVLPGMTHSWATDVNKQGQIVGYCRGRAAGKDSFRAFLWNNTFTPALPDLPGATRHASRAYAISDASRIVGEGVGSDGAIRALMWHNNAVTDLMVGANSVAYDINEAGQIVGTGGPSGAGVQGHSQAFLWENFKLTVLAQDARGAAAYAINERGQVVGSVGSGPLSGGGRAFLWQESDGMVDLNSLIDASDPLKSTFTLWRAYGINDAGVIVGVASTGAALGQLHVPFVATPI
jgi:probable HAF family extracellular repeat protein